MKGFGIFAAAAATLAALTPAPASAYRGTPIGVEPLAAVTDGASVHDNGRWHRHDDRRDWNRGRHHGWDRGRHRGWDNDRRWRWRTVCRTEWRYGHRERVCRRVRYR